MIPIAKPLIGEAEKKAVLEVLDSGMLAQGEKVAEFEKKFADYIGTKYAVATTNGTQALIMALACAEIKGEVLVPSFSFIASATSVIATNNKPVFVDVDSRTFNIDLNDLKKKITRKTKAVIPVHLFGQSCQMTELMEIAEKHDLIVIEDACQSHGSMYDKKKVGSFGLAGAFSFYPTKNITMGEGGIVTTDNEKLAEKMRLYRNHGQVERYYHRFLGFNFRTTNIAAAIGLEQLKKLDDFIEKRRKNAAFYNKNITTVELPFTLGNAFHTYNQFTIKTDKREQLIELLKKNEIGYAIYYPVAIHEQEIMTKMFGKTTLQNTEMLTKQVLSIPVHPMLSRDELKKVSETINML